MKKREKWISRAKELLRHSLAPSPSELNELDWKQDISPNKEQLKKHLSGFSNYSGGGFIVFGINDCGRCVGVSPKQIENIKTSLGNLARMGTEPAIQLDFAIEVHKKKTLLFIKIPESLQKPVHIRGKSIEVSYTRSMGQTRKMHKTELAHALLHSRIPRYEELTALSSIDKKIINDLDYHSFYKMQNRTLPSNQKRIIENLKSQKLILIEGKSYNITNLGVLTCAKRMQAFQGHERRGIRIITYSNKSRIHAIKEIETTQGYAIGFEDTLSQILKLTPSKEKIGSAFREIQYLYPLIIIRELLANAIIHQDLNITSSGPTVEIFTDRIEFTSPGKLTPSIKINRIIDTTPESRNELFARFMRQIKICEERGTGIDRIIEATEQAQLPPVLFLENSNSFKAIIYPPKLYKNLSQEEKLRACYQHCVLKFISNEKMMNASLRKRFGISDSNHSMVTRVINKAILERLIKKDKNSSARKFTYYIPIWA